ncbi:MAG: DUF1835 domain-containing protein [Firmicutes bacterium]|nr:DUF1835 domain-containing protein [Bacillota bacterium]
MRPSLTKPIHICFDSHVHGILEQCGAALEGTRENSTILTLSDDLALGPLVPETPALRRAALEEIGVEVPPSFDADYKAFLQALTTLPPDCPCYIWASDSPHERTGVALAGAYLAPQRDTFFLCDSAALVRHLEAEDWGAGDALMAQAPVAETKVWAALWEKLKAENASLRIVKDGLPCSAPADFFDPWLRADLAQYPEEDEFHIAFRSMKQHQATYGGTFSIYYLMHRAAALRPPKA